MNGLLVVELVIIALLVIVAVIALWRARTHGRDRARPAVPDEEPKVLSVDLSDRDR